jgi:hypothetical protein
MNDSPRITIYWRWRPKAFDHPDAHRCPPWPMTEAQAAQWSALWSCAVEKIEGSEWRSTGSVAGGAHRQ